MSSKVDFTIAPSGVVLKEIGERVAENRLQQNITQEALAQKAGVAVRTLRRLEAGSGGSVETLVRLLQALGQADSLDLVLPRVSMSPMQAIKVSARAGKGVSRVRARKKRIQPKAPWTWGEKETP